MEFKSHVFFSKLYEELQFRLRRLRLERRRLSARLRRPFFSCEPVSASGASSHRLALFEVVRRLTRFRTHDCGDSALCESSGRDAEVSSHAYVILDAPGCRGFGRNT